MQCWNNGVRFVIRKYCETLNVDSKRYEELLLAELLVILR